MLFQARLARRSPVGVVSALLSAAALGQVGAAGGGGGGGGVDGARPLFATAPIHYTVDTGPQACTVRLTGERVMLATDEVWGFACGSDTTGRTAEDLQRIAAAHESEFGDPSTLRVASASGVRGYNEPAGYGSRAVTINFVLGASVPAAAVPSFTRAAQYMQGIFANTYTVTVNVSFASLGSGVIGATSSNFVRNVSYSTVRSSLISRMDATDTIQNFLPTPTFPTRRGSAAAITTANSFDATRANYNVAIGTSSGVSGSMQYNSGFSFDFDPSDGVTTGTLSLTDTIVHETLHAMGFVSRADSTGGGNPYLLDLFRFRQSTENPSTTAEFQTFPRLIAYNDPTTDDVVSDTIAGQWRMSDGTPYQASHFYQQSGNPNSATGIMQPALADGVTFFPQFMKDSDVAMMDAIGWDASIPCNPTVIHTQPVAQSACQGQQVSLSVEATGDGLSYQWRRNGSNIVSGTTATLTWLSVSVLNAATYDCVVTGDCGTVTSNAVSLTVGQAPFFTSEPASQSACGGQPVSFSVGVAGTPLPTVQWRKDGADIAGATGLTLSIGVPGPGDAGVYDCVLTNSCGTAPSSPATLTAGPVCAADYDGSGGVPDAADVDAFFTDWLAGAACADVDGSGGTPDAGDVDTFFALWLAGGC